MLVKSIFIQAFRNLETQEIAFGEGINVLVGDNGQGKTSVLEAIHVLSALRSFRSASSRDLIERQSNRAEVRGDVVENGVPIRLKVVLDRSGRRVWFGERQLRGVQEYLGHLRIVAFSPDDLLMIKGPPSIRRRFLDRAVFLFEPSHLESVRNFGLALKSRNKILRGGGSIDRKLLDSFSESMSTSGINLSMARQNLLKSLGRTTEAILKDLDNRDTSVEIRFRPGWRMTSTSGAKDLLEQLRDQEKTDIQRKVTSIGPQHDDFEILLWGSAARKFASQGQQRVLALSLLLAIVAEVLTSGSERPVLLLDDVSSELDRNHRVKLFERIRSLGGQVVITTTDEKLVGELGEPTQKFMVCNGKVLFSPAAP